MFNLANLSALFLTIREKASSEPSARWYFPKRSTRRHGLEDYVKQIHPSPVGAKEIIPNRFSQLWKVLQLLA